MFKSSSPLNVQFEITYQCNNRCIFCYNGCDSRSICPVSTEGAKRILHNLVANGVLGVNFNGGEPLARDDFFELATYAKDLGLDIHLNTNATLVCGEIVAKKIAALFPAVCTSVLSFSPSLHDRLCGREGAFLETVKGIQRLQTEGVYVAVNIMLCKENAADLLGTLELLRTLDVQTVLVTRFVSCGGSDRTLHMEDNLFFEKLRLLSDFQRVHDCFARISLPQPIPLCQVPVDLVKDVRHWNIPCNIGLCTASVSCTGELTPCNLVKEPVLGNLLTDDFAILWDSFDGKAFCEEQHLLPTCLSCGDIACCGGGCKGYNDGMRLRNRKDREKSE